MLDSCPTCDYALAGLPVRHNCPECGSAFDKRSSLFEPKKGKWRRGRRGMVRVVVPLCINLAWLTFTLTRMGLGTTRFVLTAIPIGAAVTCAYVAGHRWRNRGQDTRIMFTLTHLEITRIRRRTVRLPWARIGRLEFDRVWGGAILRRANGEVLSVLRLFDSATTKQFVRDANAWRDKLSLASEGTDEEA